jgi:large subunit ribosomal protein L20
MGYNYSTFINNLNKSGIIINRKMISELAISNPNEFKVLVDSVMKA